MHTLKNHLKVSEDLVAVYFVCYGNTQNLVEDLYRKAQREVKEDWPIVDFQVVKTALKTMKSDYLYLLSDRDHILKVVEIYVDQSNR